MMVFPNALQSPRREPGAAHVLSDLFVLLLIVVVIVGAVAHQPLMAALGALALVVALTGRLWARLSLEEVTHRRELSADHVFAGDELQLILTVENKKPLPVPWIKVRDFIPTGLDAPDADATYLQALGGSELTLTTSLGRYERVRRRHRLIALKRGYYLIGPARLESGDLFGLYQSRRDDTRSGPPLVVYPRAVPLPGFFLPSARPVGDARSLVRLWADPNRPNGVREYRPGDPIRSVDWKATARLQSLSVRTYDPSVSQYAVILLDATTTQHPWDGYVPEVLERAVTGAASVAVRTVDLGYRVGFVTNGVPPSEDARMVIPPAAGQDQLPAILEALAMVRPMTVKTIEEMLERDAVAAVPMGATLVYIAGFFRQGTLDALARLQARGHPTLLMWAGLGEPPGLEGLGVIDARQMFGETADEARFMRPGGAGHLVESAEAAIHA